MPEPGDPPEAAGPGTLGADVAEHQRPPAAPGPGQAPGPDRRRRARHPAASMSYDLCLAEQRRLYRQQWAKDAAALHLPAPAREEPCPGVVLRTPGGPGTGREHDRGLLAGQQAAGLGTGQDAASISQAPAEPGARSAPAISPASRPDVPEGQREVLALLSAGRVSLSAVLASRDPDARALRVRDLLEADHHVVPAAAAEAMQAVGGGDVRVGDLTPAQRERVAGARRR